MKVLKKLAGPLRAVICITTILLPGLLAAQILNTAAGGFVGDGGPGTAASLAIPEGVAIDSAGNLYVADFSQQRVRKLTPSGIISTVAGTGIAGFSGDGGPATAAMLLFPTGVAVDAQGNLLITAQGNSRIRKVSRGETITTIAGNGSFGFSGDGGPATQATLNAPWGITLDAVGNIYFTDIINERVRKIDTSGIITTVAGNGGVGFNGDNIAATSASLSFPRGLVLDGAGNLYIADTGNHRVRKVDTSGTITTVAGNGSTGNGGDGELAVNASVNNPRYLTLDSSGNLLISATARVRKVDLTSGIITTVAGAGYGFNGDGQTALNTLFGVMSGLLFDSGGNLVLVDSDNVRIRKISPAQVVSTIAGGYIGDGGLAPAASLNFPQGATSDSGGNLYIADTDNNRVRKVSPSGTITTIAGTGLNGYSGDGGPATAAMLAFPQAVAVDSSGNVFIADNGNGVIRKVDTSGVITTFLVPGFESSSFVSAMTTDASGNLYFADQHNCVIEEATPSATVSTVAGTFACGFNGDGSATAVNLNCPSGVALDSVGNVYIADTCNNRVRKVDSGANLTTIAGNGTCGFSGDGGAASLATLCNPNSVTVSGGNIFISDPVNERIRKIDGFGNISTFAGSGSGGFNGDGLAATQANFDFPAAVVVDPAGNLYVVDAQSDRLREVLPPAPPTQSANITFSPSPTPETKIAIVGETTTDPAAQSMAITLNSVMNPITVNVQFHYEDTEPSSGHGGVGIADGICERSLGATEQTDFDCRLADGGFVYRTLANGDQVVPHIIASHNNFGVWVRTIATRVSDGQPAVAGVDYTGPVDWYYAWNTNPSLFPSPNLEYAFGWNNLNPQMFDRHGDDPDIAFKFNITTYAKFNCTPTCVGTNDPGTGGRTPTLNDIVVADPPNPPTGSADVVEPLVPVPRISPFTYLSHAPMLVAFELEKAGTEISDPTALTLPHSVSVAVLDPVTGLRQPVQTFTGFPTTFTYNRIFNIYYIVLSARPYVIGKVYQLQINSDLFPKPVSANFVVKESF
jgi:sugar lactone lactonase YvrE